MVARVRLLKIVSVLVIGAIVAVVLHRMFHPSVSKACDHMADLAPNAIVQPKIDRAFDAVPAAAKQTSPAARCQAYFAALHDEPGGYEGYNDRLGCVLDAKTLSSVAACLDK